MCVIAYKSRGAHLSDNMVRAMFDANPHGAGFMYAKDGRVHFEKGFFNVEALLRRYHACVSDDMPAVVHCRITTHGATCPQLCHPFPIVQRHAKEFKQTGEAFLCMAHNGIIPERSWWWFANPNGKDSDTSAYARKLWLEGLRALTTARQAREIEREIGGSRLAFMDGSGNVELLGHWEKVAGVWFSNTLHLRRWF